MTSSHSHPGPVRLPCHGGAFIEGEWHPADAAGDRVILFVHGLGSTRGGEKARALAGACARRGWPFAAFDFRGHGGSTGTLLDLRGSALLEDLETVRTYLEARGVRWFCLVGSSMGGWAAAWFASRHPEQVPGCVLFAPSFHFPLGLWERLSEAERVHWRATGRLHLRNQWLDAEIGYGLMEEAGRFPPETLARGFNRPLLIFHGMADEVIPFGKVVSFMEGMANPAVELRLLKGGDHRLTAFKETITEEACIFFDRLERRGV